MSHWLSIESESVNVKGFVMGYKTRLNKDLINRLKEFKDSKIYIT
ncbi:hypothetical protein [Leptospira mayottensis]|nr:hypothetical protein [Leptospira mayottensis]